MSDPLVARLRAAGCVFAEDEAAVLRAHAASTAELEQLVARRVAGEPLEVVVGHASFLGLRLAVCAGVFVPRRRTEWLAEQAIAQCGPRAVLLDLCCGAGAVAAAVARAVPAAELHCADVSAAALRCAAQNVGRAAVHRGDLYAALPAGLRGRVDVLAANAPYVPSAEVVLMPPEARDHEPREALDGGADGLDLHRRIAAGAPEWLSPAGVLLIETSRRQASGTAAAMAAAGLHTEIRHDTARDATVVLGTRS